VGWDEWMIEEEGGCIEKNVVRTGFFCIYLVVIHIWRMFCQGYCLLFEARSRIMGLHILLILV
jgi:hypothetical protein